MARNDSIDPDAEIARLAEADRIRQAEQDRQRDLRAA